MGMRLIIRNQVMQARASEGFSPGGLKGFFQGGLKVKKFDFSHSKLQNILFTKNKKFRRG